MGLSSKKVKTTEKATTTPTIPSAVQPALDAYNSGVTGFLGLNPQSLVTPANSLQTQAGAAAGLLGGGTGFQDATAGTKAAITALGSQTNPTAALAGVKRAQNPGLLGTTTAKAPNAYETANVAGITPQNVSTAALGGLNPVTKATSQGYTAPTLGNAQNVNLRGYDAAQISDPTRYLDGSVERVQGQSLLDNLDAYKNPYLRDVVDTTAADFDQYAGQQRAQQAADMARTGAFGGSRAGIREAQTEGELARGRASTLAGLRSDAFNTAIGASNLDAGRRQEAGLYNADAQNTRDLARGQMGFQGDMFNAGATNDARAFGADAYNTGQAYNATANNDFRARQAGMDENAAQFGAGAANTANLANAGYANQYGIAQFDAQNQLNQFNSSALNDAESQRYSLEGQNAQQNADAVNRARQQIYGTEADMRQFNAGETNTNNRLAYSTEADNRQFNANAANTAELANVGATNDMARFGSTQDMNRIIQMLQASGQLGDIAGAQGADQRANATTQGDIGSMLWELQNRQTLAPYSQLAMAGSLLDPAIAAQVSGQTINSEGTQKSSGGLGAGLLGGLFSLGSSYLGRK